MIAKIGVYFKVLDVGPIGAVCSIKILACSWRKKATGKFFEARKSPPLLVKTPVQSVLYSLTAAPITAGLARELCVITLTG